MYDQHKKPEILIAKDKIKQQGTGQKVSNYFNRYYATRLSVAAFLLPIYLLVVSFFIYGIVRIPAQYSEKVEGTIVSRTAANRDKNGKITNGSKGVAVYTVEGKQYKVIAEEGLFGPGLGDRVNVSYNPNDPNQAKIHSDFRQIALLAGLYGLVPIVTLRVAYKYFSNR